MWGLQVCAQHGSLGDPVLCLVLLPRGSMGCNRKYKSTSYGFARYFACSCLNEQTPALSGQGLIKESLQTMTAKAGCFPAYILARSLTNTFPKVPAQFCVRSDLVYILRLQVFMFCHLSWGVQGNCCCLSAPKGSLQDICMGTSPVAATSGLSARVQRNGWGRRAVSGSIWGTGQGKVCVLATREARGMKDCAMDFLFSMVPHVAGCGVHRGRFCGRRE